MEKSPKYLDISPISRNKERIIEKKNRNLKEIAFKCTSQINSMEKIDICITIVQPIFSENESL